MNYEKNFKEEAVKLSDEIGVKKASEQIGIPYYTLAEWRQKRNKYKENAFVGSGHKQLIGDEKDRRIKELEKKNAELEQANDILKDALGFFAKDRRK